MPGKHAHSSILDHGPMAIVRMALRFVLALAAIGLSAPAEAQQITTNADYAVLMDYESGAVLFDRNGDKLMAPASMSKLMTIAMTFQALKDGHLTFEDSLPVSEHALKTGGPTSGASSMGLKAGTSVKVSDLLQGIVVQSANDAAIVLAEGLGTTEQDFAQQMTDFAREIGMKQSTFGNATGLPDPNQLMTAHELAALARYLIREFPEYYKMFAQRTYVYGGTPFANRNSLLAMNIGADGLKTGFTKDSGYGVVGSAVIGGRRLIVVINGAKTNSERGEEAKKLLDWGAKNFKEATVFAEGEIVGRARVWGGTQYYVDLVGGGPVRIVIPKAGEIPRLRGSIVYQGPLKPPVKKGDWVAVLRVDAGEAGVSEVPLYAAEDVGRGGLFARGLDSLVVRVVQLLP